MPRMWRASIDAHIVDDSFHLGCQVDANRKKPISLEQWSSLAQVFGSIGVVVSLIFVGLQIKQNTGALQRSEHNSTMEQWTVIRMAIAKNRDIAELMTAGLHGESATDAPDQLRLEHMLAGYAWAAFSGVLRTARGGARWRSAKHIGFVPGFVAAVDAMLVKDNEASAAVGTTR